MNQRKHNGAVLSLAWSSDSTLLASGGADHKALVIDGTNGNTLHVIPEHASVNGVAGTLRVMDVSPPPPMMGMCASGT